MGKKVAEAAQPLELPAGWFLTTEKGKVVAEGPPITTPFRMRVGTGTAHLAASGGEFLKILSQL